MAVMHRLHSRCARFDLSRRHFCALSHYLAKSRPTDGEHKCALAPQHLIFKRTRALPDDLSRLGESHAVMFREYQT
jgi:hypothetical protein